VPHGLPSGWVSGAGAPEGSFWSFCSGSDFRFDFCFLRLRRSSSVSALSLFLLAALSDSSFRSLVGDIVICAKL